MKEEHVVLVLLCGLFVAAIITELENAKAARKTQELAELSMHLVKDEIADRHATRAARLAPPPKKEEVEPGA